MTTPAQEIGKAFAEFYEQNPAQVQELAAVAGVLIARPLLKRKLRKLGANELQVFVYSSIITSLALIGQRTQNILKFVETPSKPTTVTNKGLRA